MKPICKNIGHRFIPNTIFITENGDLLAKCKECGSGFSVLDESDRIVQKQEKKPLKRRTRLVSRNSSGTFRHEVPISI